MHIGNIRIQTLSACPKGFTQWDLLPASVVVELSIRLHHVFVLEGALEFATSRVERLPKSLLRGVALMCHYHGQKEA